MSFEKLPIFPKYFNEQVLICGNNYIVCVTRLVVSIQLLHHLFSVSRDQFELRVVLAHLPPLACKHINTYINIDR